MVNTSPGLLQRVQAFWAGSWSKFVAFIILTPGAAFAIGALNAPGAWYGALNKPPFNPPDWLFAPVWSALYLMIGAAGLRTFKREPRGTAMRLWALQLTLNFVWSPIFFSLHRIDVALAVIVLLLSSIVAFVWNRWWADRVAALLFIPYAAWVGFATILNAALFLLN